MTTRTLAASAGADVFTFRAGDSSATILGFQVGTDLLSFQTQGGYVPWVSGTELGGLEGTRITFGWGIDEYIFLAGVRATVETLTSPASSVAPVSLTAGSGSDSLVLRISQDAYQGSAQYVVKVDGKQVGGTFTASALHGSGQSDTLTLKGDWAPGAHSVEVTFLNDAWGGTAATDRNLYVDAVSYNGEAVANGSAALMSAGAISFAFTEAAPATAAPVSLTAGSGSDSLVLRISQDAYQGSAQYVVKVDGKQVGGTFTASALHGSGQSDTLTLKGDWAPGAHSVEVTFLNDAWGGTAATDRNLYVDAVSYNGEAVANGSAALMSAGATSFAFTEAAAPGTTADTLTVYLSGDAWNGNPQAMLAVNGVQVGGRLEVTASHARDDVLAFTFTGDFGPAPTVSLSFVNDDYGGSPDKDRTLYLDGFAYNGVQHLGMKDILGYNRTLDYELDAALPAAKRAADFLDGIGVCVHLDYFDTAYGLPGGWEPNTPLVASALDYIGVGLVRVGIPTAETLPAMQALAAEGVRFNVLMPAVSSDALLHAQLDAIRPIAGSVVAIEGPNEVNLSSDFRWNGQSGNTAARAYQDALFSAVKADPQLNGADVYALSLAGVGADAYRDFGDMSADADAGNMHVYFVDSRAPASTVRYAIDLASIVTPDLPVVFTETNYTSAPNIRGSTTEAVQAKYVLDLLMDTAQAGVEATILYELLDERADPGQTWSENHFGLFRYDGSPKPVAEAMHNLSAILADEGVNASSFRTGTLQYELTGLPASGNTMLLAKSSGEFDIVVWAEPEIWDADAMAEVPAAARPVTLSFAESQSLVEIFDPLIGKDPIAVYRDVSTVAITVTDHPLVVQVEGYSLI